MEAWRELDEPWRVALQLAWEAYLAGTTPVGSVVAAPGGSVVARGRNRIFDEPGHGLAGSRLAHAEVDALSQLPTTDRYRDRTLVSTLEPCLCAWRRRCTRPWGASRPAERFEEALPLLLDCL
ncbi:MAG TPA: hypothetical protein VE984_12800 [Gaiellaceae bacterium]|nr:hypothetical protein [Gaiellaceae bacterium]